MKPFEITDSNLEVTKLDLRIFLIKCRIFGLMTFSFSHSASFFSFQKKNVLILDREEGRKKEKKKTLISCLPYAPQLGIEPAT